MVSGRRRRGIARISGAAALVIALSFAHVVAQIGVAFAAAPTVECCCGEHAADVDCGCPDCLGSVYQDEIVTGQQGGGPDEIRPCGQDRDSAIPSATSIHWNLAPTATSPPRARPAPPARRADPMPPSTVLDGPSSPS